MNKYFALILLVLYSNIATADWQYFSESDFSLWYVDLSSLKKNGDIVSLWAYQNFRKPQAGMLSARQKIEINCMQEMYKTVYMQSFSQRDLGSISDSFETNTKYAPIAPDSPMNTLRKLACK
jgi:hypothetical protein